LVRECRPKAELNATQGETPETKCDEIVNEVRIGRKGKTRRRRQAPLVAVAAAFF